MSTQESTAALQLRWLESVSIVNYFARTCARTCVVYFQHATITYMTYLLDFPNSVAMRK